MTREQTFFLVTILATFVGGFLLLYPFFKYLVFALLLTYLLHPLKRKLQARIRNRALVSILIILLVLVAIILPLTLITLQLVQEVRNAISLITESPQQDVYLARTEAWIERMTSQSIDLHAYKARLLTEVRSFLLRAAPNVLGSVTGLLLGLFIMFFVMFYSFQEGRRSFERIKHLIPLAPDLKEKLIEEVKSVTWAVIYGQVVTALIQGTLGGLGFFIFGIPNPVLWGFIMIILSFLPLIGTPVIWGPAAVFKILSGHPVQGIGLLIWGGLLVTNVDNFLKPRLISGRSNIHPVVVLLGVLGGLNLFGFIGLVVGPLILALLIAMVSFYEEDYLGIGAEGQTARLKL
jgi:predicted PurR-regulated permease PerM